MHNGSCLCGKVSYKTLSDIENVIFCHCSMCQKISGSAFLGFGIVENEAFELLTGSDAIVEYQSSRQAKRSFCRHCGSVIFWADDSEYCKSHTCFTLGTLDTEFKPKSWKHVHTEDTAIWYVNQDTT